MPNAQSNPGFVKGQVPTAGQWNSYFTVKLDALVANTATKTANYTVTGNDAKIIVDTSSGAITITIPPSLGSLGKENRVRIVKKSVTPNSNQVSLSDGTTVFAFLITENDGSGGGWLDIDSNGTSITTICGIP